MYKLGPVDNNGQNQDVSQCNTDLFTRHNMSNTSCSMQSPPASEGPKSTTSVLRRWRRPEPPESGPKNVPSKEPPAQPPSYAAPVADPEKQMNPAGSYGEASAPTTGSDFSMFVPQLSPLVPQSTARPYDKYLMQYGEVYNRGLVAQKEKSGGYYPQDTQDGQFRGYTPPLAHSASQKCVLPDNTAYQNRQTHRDYSVVSYSSQKLPESKEDYCLSNTYPVQNIDKRISPHNPKSPVYRNFPQQNYVPTTKTNEYIPQTNYCVAQKPAQIDSRYAAYNQNYYKQVPAQNRSINNPKKTSPPFPILEQRLNQPEANYCAEYTPQGYYPSKYPVMYSRTSPTPKIVRDGPATALNYPVHHNQKITPQEVYPFSNKYYQQAQSYDQNLYLSQMNQMHARLPHKNEVPRDLSYAETNQRLAQKNRMYCPESTPVEHLHYLGKQGVPQKSPKMVAYNLPEQRTPENPQNDYLNLSRSCGTIQRPTKVGEYSPVIQSVKSAEYYQQSCPADNFTCSPPLLGQSRNPPPYPVNYPRQQNIKLNEMPARNISPRRTFQENMPVVVFSPQHIGLPKSSPTPMYPPEYPNYTGYYPRDNIYPGVKPGLPTYTIDQTKYPNINRTVPQQRYYGYPEHYYQKHADPAIAYQANMYNRHYNPQQNTARVFETDYRNSASNFDFDPSRTEYGKKESDIGKSLKEFLESWEDDEEIVANLPDLVLCNNIPPDKQKLAFGSEASKSSDEDKDQDPDQPLYILGSTNISSEALPQYLAVYEQVDRLPDNIKGYIKDSSEETVVEKEEKSSDRLEIPEAPIESRSPHDLTVNKNRNDTEEEVLNLSTNRNKTNEEFLVEECSSASEDSENQDLDVKKPETVDIEVPKDDSNETIDKPEELLTIPAENSPEKSLTASVIVPNKYFDNTFQINKEDSEKENDYKIAENYSEIASKVCEDSKKPSENNLQVLEEETSRQSSKNEENKLNNNLDLDVFDFETNLIPPTHKIVDKEIDEDNPEEIEPISFENLINSPENIAMKDDDTISNDFDANSFENKLVEIENQSNNEDSDLINSSASTPESIDLSLPENEPETEVQLEKISEIELEAEIETVTVNKTELENVPEIELDEITEIDAEKDTATEETVTETEESVSEVEENVSLEANVNKNQDVTEIQETVTEIQETVTEIQQHVTEIVEKVTEIEEPVTETEVLVTEIEETVAEIEENVTEMEEVAEIKERVTEIKDITENEEKVSEIEESANEIEKNVAEIEETVNEIEEKVPEIEENVTGLQETVTETIEETVAEIKETITEISEPVTEFKEDLNKYEENGTEFKENVTENKENGTEIKENETETEEKASNIEEHISVIEETEIVEKSTENEEIVPEIEETITEIKETVTEIKETVAEIEENVIEDKLENVTDITKKIECLQNTENDQIEKDHLLPEDNLPEEILNDSLEEIIVEQPNIKPELLKEETNTSHNEETELSENKSEIQDEDKKDLILFSPKPTAPYIFKDKSVDIEDYIEELEDPEQQIEDSLDENVLIKEEIEEHVPEDATDVHVKEEIVEHTEDIEIKEEIVESSAHFESDVDKLVITNVESIQDDSNDSEILEERNEDLTAQTETDEQLKGDENDEDEYAHLVEIEEVSSNTVSSSDSSFKENSVKNEDSNNFDFSYLESCTDNICEKPEMKNKNVSEPNSAKNNSELYNSNLKSILESSESDSDATKDNETESAEKESKSIQESDITSEKNSQTISEPTVPETENTNDLEPIQELQEPETNPETEVLDNSDQNHEICETAESIIPKTKLAEPEKLNETLEITPEIPENSTEISESITEISTDLNTDFNRDIITETNLETCTDNITEIITNTIENTEIHIDANSNSSAGTIKGSITESVTYTIKDTIENTFTEIIAESIAENITKTDSITDNIEDTIIETVTETMEDTIIDTVAHTIEETIPDSIIEAITESNPLQIVEKLTPGSVILDGSSSQDNLIIAKDTQCVLYNITGDQYLIIEPDTEIAEIIPSNDLVSEILIPEKPAEKEEMLAEEPIGEEIIICQEGIEDWVQNEEIIESSEEDSDSKEDLGSKIEETDLKLEEIDNKTEKTKQKIEKDHQKQLDGKELSEMFLNEERKHSYPQSIFRSSVEEKELFINPENPLTAEISYPFLESTSVLKRRLSYGDSSPKIDFKAPKRRYSTMDTGRTVKKPIINLEEISKNITEVLENLTKQESKRLDSLDEKKVTVKEKPKFYIDYEPTEKKYKQEIKDTVENKPEIKDVVENKPEIKDVVENIPEIKDIEEKIPEIKHVVKNTPEIKDIAENKPEIKEDMVEFKEDLVGIKETKVETKNSPKDLLEDNVTNIVEQLIKPKLIIPKANYNFVSETKPEPVTVNRRPSLPKTPEINKINKLFDDTSPIVNTARLTEPIFPKSSSSDTKTTLKRPNVDPRIERPKDVPDKEEKHSLIENKLSNTFGLTEYTKNYIKMKTGQTVDPRNLTINGTNVNPTKSVVKMSSTRRKHQNTEEDNKNNEKKIKINLQDYRNRKQSTSQSDLNISSSDNSMSSSLDEDSKKEEDEVDKKSKSKSAEIEENRNSVKIDEKDQIDPKDKVLKKGQVENIEKKGVAVKKVLSEKKAQMKKTEKKVSSVENLKKKPSTETNDDPPDRKVEKLIIKPKKSLEPSKDPLLIPEVATTNPEAPKVTNNTNKLGCNNLEDNVTIKSKLDLKQTKPKKRKRRFRNLYTVDEEDEVPTKQTKNSLEETKLCLLSEDSTSSRVSEDSATAQNSESSEFLCCFDGTKLIQEVSDQIRDYEINKNSGSNKLKLTLKPVKKKKPAFSEVLSNLDSVLESEILSKRPRKGKSDGETLWTIKNKVPKVIIKRNGSGYCAVFRDVTSNPIWQPKIRLKRQKYIESLVIGSNVKC